MKVIVCSLVKIQKVFNEHAVHIAECECNNIGLITKSIMLLNMRTIQFEFYDCCKDDYILEVLRILFMNLGGVDVDWDIFNEPITIY